MKVICNSCVIKTFSQWIGLNMSNSGNSNVRCAPPALAWLVVDKEVI